MIARLAAEASPVALGATSLAEVLWRRLRISRAEARRRIAEAADLGPRRAMTGEALAPVLPVTAAGQARGEIGREHVRDHPAVLRASCRAGWTLRPASRPKPLWAGSRRGWVPRSCGRPPTGCWCCSPGRRAAHRRRAGPAALPHRGPAGRRRDERNPGPAGPRSPRHPGCGAGQVGRPGHVQPRRRNPVCGRPTQRGGRAGRPALPAAAQPRRAESHGAQRCWPRDSWVSTTGCRSRSSCPPAARSWSPGAVRRSPPAARCCR